MIRAWIILSTFVLGVLFKMWRDDYPQQMSFPFSKMTVPIQWGVYFLMEHLSAIGIAACILIKDDTPRFLLWMYFVIVCADMLYYLLFYRDEGIGFNLVKVVVFGGCMLYHGYRNFGK